MDQKDQVAVVELRIGKNVNIYEDAMASSDQRPARRSLRENRRRWGRRSIEARRVHHRHRTACGLHGAYR